MYSVAQKSGVDIASINGSNGKYSGKVNNKSVAYGRNAASNFVGYLNDYSKMPPLNFEYRYSEQSLNGIDTLSLMGASYEEMGGKTSVPVDEMTKALRAQLGDSFNADALDLNKDKMIDVAEYATSVLVSDKLSGDGQVDGVIDNNGQTNSMTYLNKKNFEIATKQYLSLYQAYGLESAQNEFLNNKNNLC